MTVPTYDYDQRHWRKIYGPEELNKIGELLTGIPADEIVPSNNKPTVRIQKRMGSLKALLLVIKMIEVEQTKY